jgi:DAK2 domain fusion protein YloV
VEGTVLSVARAAADAARDVAGSPAAREGTAAVATAVIAAAEAALSRTTDQLPILHRAGVVDAGGKGLCLVLAVAAAALTGQAPPRRTRPRGAAHGPAPAPACAEQLPEDSPGYEVMYLLDADDDAVPGLRAQLLALGDSLVVVGGDGLWNVHVHVDDVGAALEAGLVAGRPHRVRVTHFADQRRRHAGAVTGVDPVSSAPTGGGTGGGTGGVRAVVAVAFADGLAELFEQAGAQVVRATSGVRPSTAQLLDAVRAAACATGADEVVVLSNDRDLVAAAEAAAGLAHREDGTRVAVVPTRAQVQGLAALAVHEPTRSFERDLVEMTAAARHARSGAVSVADRAIVTPAGPCGPGDVLGEVEGEVTVVGPELEQVATEVLDRLLGGGGELVTVVVGAGAAGLARRCEDHLRRHHPAVEVIGYDGGQERYALLFGVE